MLGALYTQGTGSNYTKIKGGFTKNFRSWTGLCGIVKSCLDGQSTSAELRSEKNSGQCQGQRFLQEPRDRGLKKYKIKIKNKNKKADIVDRLSTRFAHIH